MKLEPVHSSARDDGPGRAGELSTSPILLVPYMWIGDFVRCHRVGKRPNQPYPFRPVDVLTTTMVAPLIDYMPGVRKGIVVDLPRRRLALRGDRSLAHRRPPGGDGQGPGEPAP